MSESGYLAVQSLKIYFYPSPSHQNNSTKCYAIKTIIFYVIQSMEEKGHCSRQEEVAMWSWRFKANNL
jgi:hypothetical protein